MASQLFSPQVLSSQKNGPAQDESGKDAKEDASDKKGNNTQSPGGLFGMLGSIPVSVLDNSVKSLAGIVPSMASSTIHGVATTLKDTSNSVSSVVQCVGNAADSVASSTVHLATESTSQIIGAASSVVQSTGGDTTKVVTSPSLQPAQTVIQDLVNVATPLEKVEGVDHILASPLLETKPDSSVQEKTVATKTSAPHISLAEENSSKKHSNILGGIAGTAFQTVTGVAGMVGTVTNEGLGFAHQVVDTSTKPLVSVAVGTVGMVEKHTEELLKGGEQDAKIVGSALLHGLTTASGTALQTAGAAQNLVTVASGAVLQTAETMPSLATTASGVALQTAEAASGKVLTTGIKGITEGIEALGTGTLVAAGSVQATVEKVVVATGTLTTHVVIAGVTATISGVAMLNKATVSGAAIGLQVAGESLDTVADITTGTVNVAGTALGGIVELAAKPTGTIIEPFFAGMKTLEALKQVGEGLQSLNGLALGAVEKVTEYTKAGLLIDGKKPTFFDRRGEGIVRITDTVNGLHLLGIPRWIARLLGLILHLMFSYSTGDHWYPPLDIQLPIQMKNMNNSRWGKNWGWFDRISWVVDVDLDNLFNGSIWKMGQRLFGILLLVFEWGTTWPFYLPSLPIAQIPFSQDIGKIVQKAILPTIIANYRKVQKDA